MHNFKAGPVAQSVELWTPRGESTKLCIPVRKVVRDSRRDGRLMFMLDVYGPPREYGYGWWQAVARRSQREEWPCVAMCVGTLKIQL